MSKQPRQINYKDETIAACKLQIIEAESKTWSIHWKVDPFCRIYKPGACSDCKGCFQANMFGGNGCSEMGIRLTADRFKDKKIKWSWDNESTMTGYEYLAAFCRRSIPALEKIDAVYFTPEGWKYEAFEEILETAHSLYEEAGGPEAKIVQPGLNCRPYGNI